MTVGRILHLSVETAPFTPEFASPDELRDCYRLFVEVSVAEFGSPRSCSNWNRCTR
jgi:hypothetical protein